MSLFQQPASKSREGHLKGMVWVVVLVVESRYKSAIRMRPHLKLDLGKTALKGPGRWVDD